MSLLILLESRVQILSGRFPDFTEAIRNSGLEEELFLLHSVNRIITQQNIYTLNILAIITDKELALINSVNNNFLKVTE